MAISGVTSANFAELAAAFIASQGKSFVISRADNAHGKATPQQWAAWHAYFARMKIPALLMERRDFYTVPAEWPHMFDASATIGDDHEAAGHGVMQSRARGTEVPVATYDPFPALRDAIDEKLLRHRPFDELYEASRRLATQGLDAAVSYLKSARGSTIPNSFPKDRLPRHRYQPAIEERALKYTNKDLLLKCADEAFAEQQAKREAKAGRSAA